MIISSSRFFKKRFKVLDEKIQVKFFERSAMFLKNRTDPLLHDHALQGNFLGFRAFSVTGDYRVIYHMISKEEAEFVNIGRHSQVY